MYKFNEHGVCTNPDKYVVLDEEHFKASVLTASLNDRWLAGYDWLNTMDGYEGGGSHPSYFDTVKTFDSENEAKRYVVEKILMLKIRDFNLNHHEWDKECRKYLDKCREYISDTYQLTLF